MTQVKHYSSEKQVPSLIQIRTWHESNETQFPIFQHLLLHYHYNSFVKLTYQVMNIYLRTERILLYFHIINVSACFFMHVNPEEVTMQSRCRVHLQPYNVK